MFNITIYVANLIPLTGSVRREVNKCSFCLGVKRAVWSAIEIASSVDLLGWYVNWSGFRVSGMRVSHDQPFKALHGCQRECYGAVVI